MLTVAHARRWSAPATTPAFTADFGSADRRRSTFAAVPLRGFWYSATILAILGRARAGSLLRLPLLRRRRVAALLPAGAASADRARSARSSGSASRSGRKRMLFDIGIAGPIAGFVVAVPALFLGMCAVATSRGCRRTSSGLSLGEPLLFKAAAWLIWGTPPDGYSLNLHPMAFAAWFGLLATALNLLPDRPARRRPHLLRRARPPVDATSRSAAVGGARRPDLRSHRAGSCGPASMRRDAVRVRPAPSARRSTRTCRSIAAGMALAARRAGDLRPLLHPGPDRAHRSAAEVASELQLGLVGQSWSSLPDQTQDQDQTGLRPDSHITVTGSTSTVTRRRRSGSAASAWSSASRIAARLRALQKQLHAVLAAQPAERRRRRARARGGRRPARRGSATREVAGVVHRRGERARRGRRR